MICCLVHCIWKSWASKKLWPHLIYLTNCSPEVTAFFSLSSTSSSSSTGSSSLSLLSFSSNFLEVSFLAGLPRGRVPGVICGCWGWAWPKIIVENYYQKLVLHTKIQIFWYSSVDLYDWCVDKFPEWLLTYLYYYC